jgi:cell division initiation protein
MAINTKKIEEITFTQSFRGYNTDEVDDFLDEIYNETMHANKLIEQLNQKIKDLESAKPASNNFNDDSTSVIANAQITADEIIAKATQKAQQILESAQKIAASTSVNASVSPSTNSIDMSVLNNLKALINNSYEQQMNMLENILKLQSQKSETQFISREKPASQIPPVSFASVINSQRKAEENERTSKDLFSEMSSIGINNFTNTSTIEYVEPPKPVTMQQPQPSPQINGIMDFGQSQMVNEPRNTIEHISENTIARAPKFDDIYQERKPESPDDIIAQILRDNNRN